MSHNTTVANVRITSLAILGMAIKELAAEGRNVRLNENRKTFRTWAGQPDKCDAVIELPGEQFDIGLAKQSDGSYVPVFDHMLDRNKAIACQFTPGERRTDRHTIGLLMQRYAVCTAEQEAAKQGHMTSREVDAKTGVIRLVAEV